MYKNLKQELRLGLEENTINLLQEEDGEKLMGL